MKHKILDRLHEEKGFLSGEKLSEEFGLSRTAIWKHVKALKADGYQIESVTRKGYKLVSSPDIVNYDEIKEILHTKIIGGKMIHFNSLESTNKTAKEVAVVNDEGTVVVAEQQTKGKGRLGREWISPNRKGLYFSVILKPDTDPTKVAKLTLLGAASVNRGLLDLGIQSLIKWPNDIVINGKKVAGILTEMSCELGTINHIIIGIGINVNQSKEEIPYDLRDRATSLLMESGKAINRKELFAAILNRLDQFYMEFLQDENMDGVLEICRENSAVIGKDVLVIQGGNSRKGHVVGINHSGELQVRFDTGLETVFSGEVSIRKEDEYI
ncbi:MAG TPA: biotin--[acetyl-CoA-carboxylase] ligase [Tissierellaceae bacterium]|jgi:BirA family biotin operon repressor/biotin-[acetyl-CoA-carboxylase] ligase|nr:biotin--[acetyl-CoA-carboxylase] ligase [Tissierellaceae bacterium]